MKRVGGVIRLPYMEIDYLSISDRHDEEYRFGPPVL